MMTAGGKAYAEILSKLIKGASTSSANGSGMEETEVGIMK